MPELASLIAKGAFEECQVVDTRPVKVKSFSKVGPKTYNLTLTREGARFEMCAKVTIAEGYPDNLCRFELSHSPLTKKANAEES